jgi:hypothetical protein
LDANGEADVWLGLSSYKLILKDANDVTQWTVDDIRTVSGEIAAQVATIVVAAGALAASNNLSDLVDVDAALGNLGIKPLTVPVTTSITNSMAATNISGYVFTPGKTVEVFYFVSRNSAAILGNGHLQLVYDGSAWNIVDGGYTFKSGTTAIHGLTFSMSGNQLKVASDASGTGTLNYEISLSVEVFMANKFDNLVIDTNTISSADTNGDVHIDPNGTGAIDLDANTAVTGNLTVAGSIVASSTSKASRFNSMTTTQRDALTATAGDIIFNTSTGSYNYYDGSVWQTIGTSSGITALTGDVTAAGPGSAAATIANDAVTNAKLANMADATIKGNNSGSTGDALDLTVTEVTAMLNDLVGDSGSGGTKGLAPAPASGDTAAGKFLKADGSWSVPAGTGISALTGDVTASGSGSQAATIAANAVTNAKLAQMAAHTFKGNNTGSTANALDLTATQLTAELNAFVGDSGSGGTKGLVPAPSSGDAAAGKFLKADGTFAVPAGSGSQNVFETIACPAGTNPVADTTTDTLTLASTDLSITGDSSTDTVTFDVKSDAITNAKLANMATQTIKGRTTAGTGDPEDLTATQATAILNAFVGDSALVERKV